MVARLVCQGIVLTVLGAFAIGTASIAIRAQGTADLAGLAAQVSRLRSQGNYAEAIPLAERYVALARQRHGENHREFAAANWWLGSVYHAQGRYAEAEPLYKRSLAILEKALGPDHPDVGVLLNGLAEVYYKQRRYAEAEPLYKRSIAIKEQTLAPGHADVSATLNTLANLYCIQGRYAECESLRKRSLAILEKALGPDHPEIQLPLHNLAVHYGRQDRHAEAEPLWRRNLAISEKTGGPDYIERSVNNLANNLSDQGRYAEAEQLYKRSLTIHETALGPDYPGATLNNLAVLYGRQGRHAEAEQLYKRSLTIREKALGLDHYEVGGSLHNLAGLYQSQGRHPEAEQLYKRSLTIHEKALGPDHPQVGATLYNFAGLYVVQRNWARAADFLRRSTALTVRRVQRDSADQFAKSEAYQLGDRFVSLVKVVHRLASEQRGTEPALLRETFATAQWAQGSEAAASLAQMSARGAKGNQGLANIVRERQDLVVAWQRRESARTAAVSQAPDKRDPAAEADNAARLTTIDTRIAEIDKTLARDFKEYAALVSPQPLSIDEVRGQLRADEALVLFLDTGEFEATPEETFVWVVTKTDARWVRSDVGTPSLKRDVAALRCGLDYDGTWGATGTRCAELLKLTYTQADHKAGKQLPFDPARAHVLYKALFGQVEDLIRDKHLLIVPSGPLTQLPFQVLVTNKLDTAVRGGDAFRRAAWLVRSHPLTVLPSVSSLRALRTLAKDSLAGRALIGFGNPLLDGPHSGYAKLASVARSKQVCPKAPEPRIATLGERRGLLPLNLRGGLVDVKEIGAQVPLPETADELCAVARDLRVGADDIRLGARATEAEIKRLSEVGELSRYRMIHFATHGALAGQLSGSAEPGLLLTPPSKASEIDDGYLSASEIAALKLDADWVILSACNTAAGGAEGAEALSGLARAFFYAGARALAVSHWAVYSEATVKLITGALVRMAADKGIGRAEGMRQSMLALIDKGELYEAHPAFWAPFVVVGEGAPKR